MNRLWFSVFSLAWCVACSSSDEVGADGSSGGTGDGGGGPTGTSGTSGTSGNPAGTRCAAPPCADGDQCIAGADCASGSCVEGLCAAPTCLDKTKNGKETDLDCGGSCVTRCGVNKACAVADDCADGNCTAGLCGPPTSGDKRRNGNETDIDCGSSNAGIPTSAPRCDAGKTCKADVDCTSGGCNVDGRCAWARSCTVKNGGTTCGAGDVTHADREHEDCCTSVEVPAYNLEGYANASAVRVDKYQITSGRMRRFLDAVNGNVQGWVATNRAKVLAPDQLPGSFDPYLPTGFTQPDSADICRPEGTAPGDPSMPCNYGALNHVSGYRFNNEPGGDGGYGCNMGVGAYGARTFYLTDAELAALNPDANNRETQHVVDRDRVEQKAMNCATYYMLAAFCAWDGGRLETLADYNAAYGGNGPSGRRYPWGSDGTTRAIGFADALSPNVAPTKDYGYTPPANNYSVFNAALTADQRAVLLTRLRRANVYYNYVGMLAGYFEPLGATNLTLVAESGINQENDQSVLVSPPGRYPLGAGRYGHRDLAGNLIEMTATPRGSATLVPTGRIEWARNGSYETSHVNATTMIGGTYDKPMLTKYARSGGRCARPYPTGYLAEVLP